MQTRLITTLGTFNFIDRDLSPSQGSSLWESCPFLSSLTDPSVAFGFLDDFLPFDTSNWTVTAFTSGSAANTTTLLGGAVALSAGASVAGQGVQIQRTGSLFGYKANKMVWMETLLQTNVLAGEFFWGLTPLGNVLTSGGLIAPANYVGFNCLTGDGKIILSSAQGGGTTISTGVLTTFGVSTNVKLGLVWDMVANTLTPWINGSAGSVIGTSSAIPIVPLLPSLSCQSNGSGSPVVTTDWVRMVQTR